MANSIDLGALAIGVALGYGLKNEIKDAGTICKVGLLGGLTAAATAAQAAGQQAGQAPAAGAPQAPAAGANGNG